MTISYWLDESLSQNKNFDIVILGAGIAGLSSAYWLEKKDPNLKIAIIDKHSIGYGASGRNAGFVTCGSAEHFNKLHNQFGFEKATEIWKFFEQNRELLKQEIIQNQTEDVDFFQTGSCTVAPSNQDWDKYQKIFSDMTKAGIDVQMVDEKFLNEKYSVRNFQGAIEYKHDGIIHPVKLLNKIKSKLKNTTFLLSEEVHQVKNDSTGVQIKTQHFTLSAKNVFVCLNAFTHNVFPEFKAALKPQRSQIILTEALAPFVKGPCYLPKHLCYFRQLHTGELLVGGFRNHDLENENTALDEITDKIQNALVDFTRSYFQNTKDVKIKHRWSGIMAFTADEQVLIGAHPTRPNTHVLVGCSGHGMGHGFNSARVLVENFFGQKIPAHLDIKRINLSSSV